MALIQCRECGQSVSTEAIACPHCGAPQQRPVPPPLPTQTQEQRIYFDNVVAVTTTRVVIGGTTYALRNITSVSMTYTPPGVLGAILLLFVGIILFFIGEFLSYGGISPSAIITYAAAGIIVCGTIFGMCRAKPTYHVCLASTAGEVHALTSKNKAYIEKIVVSINDAIVKYK
ncbi:MAG: DUF6232 family protein [Verrucomicrobiota bacterium]|jgi:hypothetical protein